MILIRADANEIIGTGHVMRCLSIAHAFANAGHEVRFVTADHIGDKLISSAGFSSVCLDSEWTEMDGEQINCLLSTYHPVLFLVDSYFVTEKYFKSLSAVCRVAYIDDLNVITWDVDYLIDYNIFGTVLDYSNYRHSHTKLLLGPTYAPLRPEFQSIPPHPIKSVTDIMVSAGGADPEGVTEIMMNELCSRWASIRFHFIVGALNPRLDNIKALAPNNAILHINKKNMSGLMQICDLAISAAGSTLYELCACGTPTVTYTLADNQLLAAEEFQKQGIMIFAGDFRRNDRFLDDVKDIVKDLIENKEKRWELSIRMQSLVDGRGAERIVGSLLNFMHEEAMEAIRDSHSGY